MTVQRLCNVGLFNDWLEQNNYGSFVNWQPGTSSHARGRCLVAVSRDGVLRVPSEAAMMEYVMVMATGDASRPKGGRPEYRMGEHETVSLHGQKQGEFYTEKNEKEYGWGPYADVPFRYRGIEQQVISIRWFYDELLEKVGGGALNPASTLTVKQLMKALSYLMGQRRINVPKALTRDVVEACLVLVRKECTDEEFAAAAMLVANYVWGARCADLYLADWSEIVFELQKQAEEEAMRTIGLTWRRLQTKNDRLGRKDAPKVLQCTSACQGELEWTEEGTLKGIPCPVHMMMELKRRQAEAAGVPEDELVAPVLGDINVPPELSEAATMLGIGEGKGKGGGGKGRKGGEEGNKLSSGGKVSKLSSGGKARVLAAGSTVVADDAEAMRRRVPPLVKVISRKEEEEGKRYNGTSATATTAMLKLAEYVTLSQGIC